MNGMEWTALRLSLHKAIQKWSDSVCEEDETIEAVGWWTNEIIALMTDAAIVTLKASADKERWLKEQGYVKD